MGPYASLGHRYTDQLRFPKTFEGHFPVVAFPMKENNVTSRFIGFHGKKESGNDLRTHCTGQNRDSFVLISIHLRADFKYTRKCINSEIKKKLCLIGLDIYEGVFYTDCIQIEQILHECRLCCLAFRSMEK